MSSPDNHLPMVGSTEKDDIVALLNASPAPVLVVDAETQRVLWVNRSAVSFYGYERDAFLALRIKDFRVEEQAGEIAALIPMAGTKEFDVAPRLHRTASGELKIVKVTASRLTFDMRPALVVAVTDVTELHRMQEEVRKARNFLRQVIDQVPTAVFAKDMEDGGRFVIYNKASEALFGRSSAHAIGSTDGEVFSPVDALRSVKQDEATLRLGTSLTIEDESIERPDGTVRRIRTRKVPLADGGRPRFVVGVCEDITDQRAMEERIAHMAHHDSLTGLPNRFLFADRLASALTRLADERDTLAVLCIDLDGFKAVNDTWGHATGDRLLQAVAGRLSAALRSCDTVARFGGDEFVILQAPIAGPGEAGRLAERLIGVLGRPYCVEDRNLAISASIGIAIARMPSHDAANLLEEADGALYRAKREGRSTYRFASPALTRLAG